MTVLTQGLSDKKLNSKQNEIKRPLVGNEVTDDGLPSAPQVDIESGSTSSLVSMRSRAQRVNSLTTLCVTLTALLVLTTGIVGGIYLYRHFAQYRLRHFRGWCSIPYVEQPSSSDRFESYHRPSNYMSSLSAVPTDEDFDKMVNDLQQNMNTMDASANQLNKFFEEEFDIDVEYGQYERIEVPDFSHGRKGRFVHDFAKNMTGIIDVEGHRCFVLPLNRSLVLPPDSLFDLVMKMRTGYYDIDTEIVRELYRVLTPQITDFNSLGYYIGRECAQLPTYRLERITSPVFKRSVEDIPKVLFSEFAGVKIHEFAIVNLNDAKQKN